MYKYKELKEKLKFNKQVLHTIIYCVIFITFLALELYCLYYLYEKIVLIQMSNEEIIQMTKHVESLIQNFEKVNNNINNNQSKFSYLPSKNIIEIALYLFSSSIIVLVLYFS